MDLVIIGNESMITVIIMYESTSIITVIITVIIINESIITVIIGSL
jgi:hypothetical protein